jgi:hypothetical protein
MIVTEAERAIADILRRLEANGDVIVDTVELVDIEVTKMEDDGRRFVRKVRINTHRLPGRDWAP